jgi:methylenetetrahydrofolate reductase (NADH)
LLVYFSGKRAKNHYTNNFKNNLKSMNTIDTNMTIPELLSEHDSRVSISVEILPPVRGNGINSIFEIINKIKDINPLWIEVTSHASNVEWVPNTNNSVSYTKYKRRKAPGTIAICGAIQYKYNIPAIPHLLCLGFSREETEDALIDLDYLGIKNVLAIKGDEVSFDQIQTAHGRNPYSLDLIEQIQRMNDGSYLDQCAKSTDFCIGVSCYPEKHFETPNLQASNKLLQKKQQQGAAFAVSQMFFNNAHYYNFLESIKSDISMPIVPGLKIISSAKQLVTIPRNFYVDIPEKLVTNMEAASTKAQCQQVGIDWAYQQCSELIENGQKHLHFYLMRNIDHFLELIKRLDSTFKFIG